MKLVSAHRGAARLTCVALLAVAVLWTVAVPALAVPANGKVWTFTQPDGTKFQAILRGDEFHAWHETPTHEIVLQDPATGFWHYVRPHADGSLEDTNVVAGQSKVETAALNREMVPWLKAIQKTVDEKAAQREMDRSPARVPATGTIKGIILLANFSDTVTTFSPSDFTNLFNTVGYNQNGASGSVRDYYLEASYGALTFQTDIYGWFQLPNTRAYYGADVGSGSASDGNDVRPREMIQDAITASETTVDYSQYDSNGDGWVDFFGVIHQGQGEEQTGASPDCIWSHHWSLASPVTVNGVKIQDYHTMPELYYTSLSTIGVMCHEMGHSFGLPDLYDTTYASSGIGMWSVMSLGSWAGPGNDGSKPTLFDPWCKVGLGWIAPTVVSATEAGVPLPAFYQNANSVLRIPVNPYNDGEYFLVCNRYAYATGQPATGFDAYCPGSGALVLHVDDYVSGNTNAAHKKVSVEEADGLGELDGGGSEGSPGDLYPNGSSTFNNTSNPNSRDYAGNATGISLTNFTGVGTANMAVDVTPRSSVAACILYDQMGASGNAMGYSNGGDNFGLVHFTAPRSGTVQGVKTYFVYSGTTNYTVNVYSTFSGALPSGLLSTKSGSHSGTGYESVALTTPVDVTTGEDFYVEVEYDTSGGTDYPIPISFDSVSDERGYVSPDGTGGYMQLLVTDGWPQDLNIRVDYQPTSAAVVAPTVADAAATDLTNASATLHGNLTDTGGENPTVHIYWGDADGATTAGNWAHDENLGVLGTGAFSTPISGLTGGDTYYYRAYASNSAGGAWAPASDSFVTNALPSAPTVTNTGVTHLTGVSATLNGNLGSTGGENPTVHIYWGVADGGTAPANWANDVNLGLLPAGDFSTDIASLMSGSDYYFRCYAVNTGGETWAAATVHFVPQAVTSPAVSDSAATAISTTGATFNGTVTATGGETPHVTVFYGTTDGGAAAGAWDESVDVGLVNAGPFAVTVSDLDADTQYFFRARAVNSAATAWADTSTSFTTTDVPLVPPTGLTATKGDSTDVVSVAWNPVDGADSYKVFWADSATATPQELTDWIPDTNYDDGDIVVGEIRYYWVEAASDSDGDGATAFSNSDDGWLGMDGDPANFQISYSNCSVAIQPNSFVQVSNALGASISIQVLKKLPASTAPVPGKLAFLLGSPGIPVVDVNGSVSKFSSSAPIGRLRATGTVSSVSTKGDYIRTISADALGTVKMTAYAESDSYGDQFLTSIYTGDQNSTGTLTFGAPTLKLSLVGVGLNELRAPHQTVWIGMSSKKWRNPDGDPDLSMASVPYNDTNVVEAGSLWQLSTKGGEITPARILGDVRVRDSSLIYGQGILFTGSMGPSVYDGLVYPDEIASGADQLSVVSLAGDVSTFDILAAGEIALLGAQHKAFRIEGDVEDDGGNVGVPESDGMMRVVSGTDATASNANIAQIYGSASVAGNFYAGGDGTHGIIFRGFIGQIATSNPSATFPDDPTITGSGWSSQVIRFIGGDHSGFVENYP